MLECCPNIFHHILLERYPNIFHHILLERYPNVFSVYRRICFPSGTMCHCFKFRKSRRELALIKAFSEFKASRRPGKHIRCFKCFCQNRQFKTQNSKSALPTIQNSKLKIQNSFYPFLPLFFYLFTPFYATTFWVTLFFCSNFAPDLATKIIKQ